MQFASWKEIIVGIVGVLVALALFQLFSHFAKQYDKKHPNAPRTTGHYMTPKASYDMSKGETIFHSIYFFAVVPILIIIFAFIWDKAFH